LEPRQIRLKPMPSPLSPIMVRSYSSCTGL